LDLCRAILERAKVLVMPGEVFGGASACRLTFVRNESELTEGLARIGAVLDDVVRSR
jgi:aspartate/methionine/tyrosine aminotransferase